MTTKHDQACPIYNGRQCDCNYIEPPASSRVVPTSKGVDERAAFEAWYGDYPFDLAREPNGEYSQGGPLMQWEAWQARAALSAPPAPTTETASETVKPEFAQFMDTPQKRFLYDWGRKDGYQDGYADALASAAPPDGGGRGLTEAEIDAVAEAIYLAAPSLLTTNYPYEDLHDLDKKGLRKMARAAIDRAPGGVL